MPRQKKDAKILNIKLAREISTRLTLFEQRFGVNIKLTDELVGYIASDRCQIKVTL